jgi:hypothetical protein
VIQARCKTCLLFYMGRSNGFWGFGDRF